MRMRRTKWSLGAALAVASLASANTAFADEVAATKPAPAEAPKDEPKIQLGLDLVMGFGRTTFATQALPAFPSRDVTYYREDASSRALSFLASGSYGLSPNLRLGARIPFSFVNFEPASSRSRAAFPFGNIELSLGYGKHDALGTGFIASLGLQLPTGQGDEIPSNDVLATQLDVDQNALDRYSANRSASKSRGYEVDELYQPKRIGLTPRFVYRYVSGKLTVEPYLKVANLLGVVTLEHAYLGMVIPGVRAGYRASEHVEVALRAWGNVAFAGSIDEDKVSLSVEPQLVLHLGSEVEHLERFRPTLGIIVPLVGPSADPRFIGVRLGLSVGF
jgi:hypothetical protein